MKTYEERLPLIDEAIYKNDGKFPDLDNGTEDDGEPFLLVRKIAEFPNEKAGKYVRGCRGYLECLFSFICTRKEFNQRKAELQNKPSWSDAPEWANWLAQDADGYWVWYQTKPFVEGDEFGGGLRLLGHGCGKVIGSWRDTLEKRPDNIVHSEHQSEQGSLPTECVIEEQPMKYEYGKEYVCNGERPEGLADDVLVDVKAVYKNSIDESGGGSWLGKRRVMSNIWENTVKFRIVDERYKPTANDWHKRGELPPVGAVCGYETTFFTVERSNKGVCKIIAYHGDKVWIDIDGSTDSVINVDVIHFQPIRTATDKLEQDILDYWNNKGVDCPIAELELANHLYEQGYRKTKRMGEDEFVTTAQKELTGHFSRSKIGKLYRAGCRFIDQGKTND